MTESAVGVIPPPSGTSTTMRVQTDKGLKHLVRFDLKRANQISASLLDKLKAKYTNADTSEKP